MKKFLFTTILFCITFFFTEKVFYAFLYVSPSLEKDKRLEYVINGELNKELIILGSSRGARNIIASQIEDSLNISSYNLSYPGSNIEFHEFLLRSLIKFNEPPKIVLLVVDDPSELLPNNSINFRLDRLYPLAKYEHINNELVERGEKSWLSKFFVLARINRKNFDLREREISKIDSLKKCGSMPISIQKEGVEFVYQDNRENYDLTEELSAKVNAFKKFQRICVLNNIKLYIVFPPNFKAPNLDFEKRIKGLSHPSVSFYHYDITNQVYKDKNYYYDGGHLKLNGARIFTDEIIKKLKGT